MTKKALLTSAPSLDRSGAGQLPKTTEVSAVLPKRSSTSLMATRITTNTNDAQAIRSVDDKEFVVLPTAKSNPTELVGTVNPFSAQPASIVLTSTSKKDFVKNVVMAPPKDSFHALAQREENNMISLFPEVSPATRNVDVAASQTDLAEVMNEPGGFTHQVPVYLLL